MSIPTSSDVDSRSIYAPVRDGLLQVEENLRQVCQEGFSYLSQLLEQALLGHGKRVRPAITLLAAQFHKCDPRPPVLMATAVELLHIATLIHDDTVDNAPIRRGRPTLSSLFGKQVAVLVGDYVFARSATSVCETNNIRAVRRFAETIMALSRGELREIVAAYDWRQGRENYWQRIADKTASLFSMAAETGALLSGAPEPTVQALCAYGTNLGMAFQVVDDILDYQGNEAEVGKPVGSDLLQGTLTLPAIMLVERHPDDNPIRAVFGDKGGEANLKRALDAITASDIIPECYRVAEEFVAKACAAIAPMEDNAAKRSLLVLADYVLARRK